MSARSVIEHALTVYYADSTDPKNVVDRALANYDAEHRAEVLAEAAALTDEAVALFDDDEGALTAGALECLADRFRQMAGEKATATAATATTGFFRPGHTYTDSNGYQAPELVSYFLVEHVTRHPDRGHRRAIGWLRSGEPGAMWHGDFRDEDEYAGWTDVTEAGAADA